MTKIYCSYAGDGQTALEHGPTKTRIITDLPPDNGGRGRAFSPTDLFAASLAACALTIMGKMAAARGQTFEGAAIEIDKIMADNPRRIGKFIIEVKFPPAVPRQERPKYLAAFRSCPVHNSLGRDIEIELNSN